MIVSVVQELVVVVAGHTFVTIVDHKVADILFECNQFVAQYYSLYSSMMRTSKSASGNHSDKHYLNNQLVGNSSANNHFPKSCYSTSSGSVDDSSPSSLCCMAS